MNSGSLNSLNGQRHAVENLLPYHTAIPTGIENGNKGSSNGHDDPVRKVSTVFGPDGRPRLKVVSVGGILTGVEHLGVEIYSKKLKKKR